MRTYLRSHHFICICFWDESSLCIMVGALKLAGRLGWPWTCDSHPAPVFLVLRLQACANEPGSSAASLWEPWWLDVDILVWLFFLLVAKTALVRIRFPHPPPPTPSPFYFSYFHYQERSQWKGRESVKQRGEVWGEYMIESVALPLDHTLAPHLSQLQQCLEGIERRQPRPKCCFSRGMLSCL